MNVITIETVKDYDKTLDKTSFSISNNFFFRTHPYFKPYYGERPPSKFAKAARLPDGSMLSSSTMQSIK